MKAPRRDGPQPLSDFAKQAQALIDRITDKSLDWEDRQKAQDDLNYLMRRLAQGISNDR
jgi:hypothetical protein